MMNDKNYQIMELKQRISYYEPYKQKYEDLKEDWKYIKSLLDKEFNERTGLKKENEELKKEYKIAIDEMITDYKKLENENEQLRKQIQKLESENEDLREVNKETVKQCERWKNLYELKDAEVTARVDALNKVCEYYTSEQSKKS